MHGMCPLPLMFLEGVALTVLKLEQSYLNLIGKYKQGVDKHESVVTTST